MFDTVLIANRGEIACRIIRTLRSMGIRSVAVYSDADADARHVRLADAAVRLGPAPAAQSYLDIEAVIAAARATSAQAIHPGYGFLSESAPFALACERAGIAFIGPSASAIEVMGDKITAKHAVEQRGVPTVPGVARQGMDDEDLIGAAPGVGFPLLIKPSAGGGGKGMHVVEAAGDLRTALQAARREAAASFGDDTLFLERYVQNPRHIEVQVLADGAGNVVHLGERECSLQRRHQKVVEEAPSPLLDARTRERIGIAACDTARSVSYRGAGTVEFIVAADRPDDFFFMEMNTRLQVEHPVTEEVTGIDLVEQQVRIAAGELLPWTQDEIRLTGHSIEVRVYAEDPQIGFLPTGGRVSRVVHPAGDGIRVDSCLDDGLEVSVDYDPMLAKIIATGANRDEARRRLVAAIDGTAIFGFPTNLEFLRGLLELPAVVAGDLDTRLIAREFDAIPFQEPGERVFTEAALLLDAAAARGEGVWRRRDGWRLGEPAERGFRLTSRSSTRDVALRGSDGNLVVVHNDGDHAATARLHEDGSATVAIDGRTRTFAAVVDSGSIELTDRAAHFAFSPARSTHAADTDGDEDPVLQSPMPGTVILLRAADGDRVKAGDPVIVVEAMKMEHVITSSVAGVVTIHVGVGDRVARGETLAVVTADPEEGPT